jgi:hypothetical protein
VYKVGADMQVGTKKIMEVDRGGGEGLHPLEDGYKAKQRAGRKTAIYRRTGGGK